MRCASLPTNGRPAPTGGEGQADQHEGKFGESSCQQVQAGGTMDNTLMGPSLPQSSKKQAAAATTAEQ